MMGECMDDPLTREPLFQVAVALIGLMTSAADRISLVARHLTERLNSGGETVRTRTVRTKCHLPERGTAASLGFAT